MSKTTLLVRHAQASFGSHNYDRLSELGVRQAEQLGRHLANRQASFEAVYLGNLQRHLQTFEGIRKALGGSPEPIMTNALNEYDPEALLRAAGLVPRPEEGRAHHFKLLRLALKAWMAGDITPTTMPAYSDFREGLLTVLKEIRASHSGKVLVVTSGGPIATVVGSLLEASVEATIAINFRVRNASITELAFDEKRHHVVGLNHIDHLAQLGDPKWITYV